MIKMVISTGSERLSCTGTRQGHFFENIFDREHRLLYLVTLMYLVPLLYQVTVLSVKKVDSRWIVPCARHLTALPDITGSERLSCIIVPEVDKNIFK